MIKIDLTKEKYSFDELVELVSFLTSEHGCPWDKVQTHNSIRGNMLEEANEAVEAIDSGDMDNLKKELGDVLLQSVLHSDIAKRAGEFDIGDVISSLCKKIINRHTHVFGSDKAYSAEEAMEFWKKAKKEGK
ncbi:MAG: nucleotide pyrophosphohydrolase [Firmicutes bacterium]|nr:nucleotide pyrophosphohydrolase [Bacillota bacterium]